MKNNVRLFFIYALIPAVLFFVCTLDAVCRIAQAQGLGSGAHLLRKSTRMPDGRMKVGDLIVQEGQGGQEAKVKTIRVDAKGNAKEEWMTMSELGQIAAGKSELKFAQSPEPDDKKLHYGVSVDNKLLICIKGTGNKVRVVRDLKGVYDMQVIDKRKVILVDGVRMADGRIRVTDE